MQGCQPVISDQMPRPPGEGQLICTLFLSMRQYIKQHNSVILPHESWHHLEVLGTGSLQKRFSKSDGCYVLTLARQCHWTPLQCKTAGAAESQPVAS